MTRRIRRLSVLVVSWNGREHLETCLPTLLGQRAPGVEIELLVLDNGSTDGSVELVRKRFPAVRLVESTTNLGFAGGVNRLARVAEGEALALVNNDTRAEEGWAERLVERREASSDDAVAVAGRIVDWEGERLDFGRGIVTFDGHAFPLDQGRAVGTARLPEGGEELLFGCGGNLLVDREAFLAAGGFDPRFFAYLEDVDLGWRLWARGLRVVAEPGAVLRHRLSATSSRLGNRRRGFLFERNALWTVLKNLGPELRPRLLPAILLTYLSRIEGTLSEDDVAGLLRRDPLTGASIGPRDGGRTAGGDAPTLRRRIGRFLGRLSGGRISPLSDQVRIQGDRSLAHLQALSAVLADLEGAEAAREPVERARRRSDLEIFRRFPLWVVPTYPGDERLFASPAFAAWLPEEIPFERAALDDVLERG